MRKFVKEALLIVRHKIYGAARNFVKILRPGEVPLGYSFQACLSGRQVRPPHPDSYRGQPTSGLPAAKAGFPCPSGQAGTAIPGRGYLNTNPYKTKLANAKVFGKSESINNMKLFAIAILICLFTSTASGQKENVKWKKVKVLVYTKNGKGYVHENIPSAVMCIQKLGQQYGFKTDVSEAAVVFTEENLKQYSLLIFTSTNNNVFDTDEQRLAFRRFIEAGGGFVGIHSVIGTERNWPWFKMMLGGTFAWHPKFQKYKIQVIDPGHPSVAGLPKVWEKEDECYFQKEMYPGIRTVMAHELSSLNGEEKEKITAHAASFPMLYPAVWYQQFDGGTIWITTLGHDKKDYEDPIYVQHIFQGIKFVASKVKSRDYKKAYAKSKDEPVQY